MSYRRTAPRDSKTSGSFGFLKTVVSDGPSLERNDSDKENDQGLMTVTEELSETKGSVENSKGQVHGHLSQGLHGFENTDSTAMAKDEEKDMWDEFYNEEDFIVKKDETVPSNGSIGITDFTTTFEIENNRVLDKVEEEQEGMDERSQGDDYSSTFDSSVKDDDGDRNTLETAGSSDNKRKPRKKKKRLFKRRLPPAIVTTCLATGGSHPDLGQQENNFQTNQLETMSESGGTGERGRRLSRRKQAARPRCAGPTPNGDVLQQKYQELEQLVLKPLANPAIYVKQTRQQMLRLQGLSSQYHISNHSGSNHVEGLPPPSGNPREERSRQNHVIVEENTDQGYSTIRTIQVVQNGTNSSTSTRQNRPQTAHPRRPRSGQREVRPASAGRGRPTSANCQTRENMGNVNGTLQVTRGTGARGRGANKNRGGRSQSGSSKGNRTSDSGSKDRSSRDSQDSRDASSDNPSRSNSRSPRRVVPCADTHLKYSDNPALREWLKTKNKQHRQRKLEERKKKREERTEKQEIERKRQEVFQDSDKKVKEWIAKKRKEAFKKAKEEKKKAQEEEMEMIEWREHGQYTGSLRGHSMRRPQSAPAHSDRKMFIPVIRPDGDHATNNTEDLGNSETPTPHPPKSKFVYKRPVSGRVRLMKLQQERKEDSKKQEMQKKEMEKLTEEEKNRKMRISYDQWLVKKRQEDYEKRQKAARERALAKSDPELQRIVPEMARRRIENIQRGKKRIQTNVDPIDAQVNKSFGGGEFGEEEAAQNRSPNDAPGLQVSGQKKSLGQRPSSAKPSSSNSLPNPQISKSPRRPKSAHPRVQSIMDDSEEQQVVDAKAFQLPFPPELGVPKYVAERQEKLFSAKIIENASTDTMPLSTDANFEDTESQQPPASTKNDNFQGRETENDSHREDSEAAKFETQDFSKVKSAEIFKDAKADQDDVDSSFFVTDGNVEIVDVIKEEIVLCETIPAEAFDDDESDQVEDMTQDQQENSESNEDKNTVEEGVADTNVEYKSDEEEVEKMSDVEEAPTMSNIEIIQALPEESVLQELDETLDLELEKSEELHCSFLVDEQIVEEEVLSQIIGKESMEEESVGEVREGLREEKQMKEKEVQGEEEEPKSEASEGKSSTKHVSFVEEAEIHEDPLAGIPPEDYDTFSDEDEAEDERGDFYGDESPRNENEFWEGGNAEDKTDSYDDDYF